MLYCKCCSVCCVVLYEKNVTYGSMSSKILFSPSVYVKNYVGDGLVHPFGHPVSLGVICSGFAMIGMTQFHYLFGNRWGQRSAFVGYYD